MIPQNSPRVSPRAARNAAVVQAEAPAAEFTVPIGVSSFKFQPGSSMDRLPYRVSLRVALAPCLWSAPVGLQEPFFFRQRTSADHFNERLPVRLRIVEDDVLRQGRRHPVRLACRCISGLRAVKLRTDREDWNPQLPNCEDTAAQSCKNPGNILSTELPEHCT